MNINRDEIINFIRSRFEVYTEYRDYEIAGVLKETVEKYGVNRVALAFDVSENYIDETISGKRTLGGYILTPLKVSTEYVYHFREVSTDA